MNGKTIQQMIPTREGWELALEFMVDQEWFIGKGGKIWRVRMLETASNGSLRTATVAGDFDSLEETGMYLLFILENEWEQKAHNQENPPTLQEGVHYELVAIIPSSLHPVVTKHTERESELKAAKVALGVFYDPPENPMNDPLHPATEQMIEVLESGGFVMGNVEPQKQGHPIIDGMIELESEEPPNVDRVEELNEDPENGESSPEPPAPDFFEEVVDKVDKILEPLSPERPRDLLSISSRYVAGMNARTLARRIMDHERLEVIRAWRGITLSYYVDRVLRDAGKTGIETSRVQLSGPWETEDQAIGWIARERFSTEEITMAINDLNDFMNYPEDKFFDRGEWEDEISLIRDLLRRILADVKEREG